MIKKCFKCDGTGSGATRTKFNAHLKKLEENNVILNIYKLIEVTKEFNDKYPCKLCNKTGVLHYEKL